jgi:hypothetical protein
MAQVQFTVSVTVTAPAAPLAEGSSSGPASFVQGVQSTVILTPITGGQPPYTASVDAASPSALPAGITAGIDPNNNLILSGAATAAGGPASVLLDVIDSAGAVVASVRARV